MTKDVDKLCARELAAHLKTLERMQADLAVRHTFVTELCRQHAADTEARTRKAERPPLIANMTIQEFLKRAPMSRSSYFRAKKAAPESLPDELVIGTRRFITQEAYAAWCERQTARRPDSFFSLPPPMQAQLLRRKPNPDRRLPRLFETPHKVDRRRRKNR